jgi:hypothetical protein
LENPSQKRAGGMAQAVEPSKSEALSSNLCNAKKKKKVFSRHGSAALGRLRQGHAWATYTSQNCLKQNRNKRSSF